MVTLGTSAEVVSGESWLGGEGDDEEESGGGEESNLEEVAWERWWWREEAEGKAASLSSIGRGCERRRWRRTEYDTWRTKYD